MKNNIIGFSISLLLHIALFVAFFANFKNNFETKQESVSITLNNFILEENAGQNSDANEIKKEEVVEQEIIQEEKVEEAKEEIVEEKPQEIVEEKPAVVVKKPKKTKKIDKVAPKVVKNDAVKENDGIAGKNASAIGNSQMAVSTNSQDENILAKIRQIIASYAKEHYPTNAKKRRQQGIVSVEFTYHKNGSVSGLKIVKSSNSSYLDEGALKVIEKTKSRFPKLSDKESMTIKVPIEFKLH
ncbi:MULTISPECIES: energy transducer TonB [unclassified Campylobacter]|uniref:energy transducer TonB n=1 Tax=unclassified Campylobacter TaxID=2593542 RepID=UPI0022E9C1AA|nr:MULTISPECIES: energy transducer TonB [unclassified Campylobacter]MDA3078856.1 energy transducer TonB [Campylobacter sp. CS_NA2]MDA3084941.1 energy transducer TonB [Campylobacter sp. CS_ED1]MDA3089719.1 energy transducer TonB [Campylobacter sp. CS_ED2]WBR51720.1 energy transducer TonB [Campylobacter sp. CS_NA3]